MCGDTKEKYFKYHYVFIFIKSGNCHKILCMELHYFLESFIKFHQDFNSSVGNPLNLKLVLFQIQIDLNPSEN